MIVAVRAEALKLTGTRAPLAAAVAAVALSVGMAALLAYTAYIGEPMSPGKAASGAALLGVPILMVPAALSITDEYRSGMIRTSFLAVPNRALVLAAKAVVAAAYSAVVAAVAGYASVLAARAVARPKVAAGLDPTGADTVRTVAAIAVVAALAAALGVGAGALIRAGSGAVAVVLLWPLVAETALGILPGVGARVGPYLPFAGAWEFAGITTLYSFRSAFGSLGGLGYFAVVAAALLAAGMLTVTRRDA